jgi:hypothetical protein
MPLEGYDILVKTAEEAIELIRSGIVSKISFDHDLGEGLTGYDVAKEIEDLAREDKIKPIDYYIHTGNPVGANNIDRAMKQAEKYWSKDVK